MNKSPAYQWYPDKWRSDTMRLTWAAKGIYKELLDIVWLKFQDSCSIPNDDEYIASELRANLDDWKRAKSEIMQKHDPLLVLTETNRLFSKGLWKEREKQRLRRERLAENGKKGGRPVGSKNQKVLFGKPRENLNERLSSSSLSSSLKNPPTPRMSETEKRRHRVKENSDLMVRIGKWFHRKPTTRWTLYEKEALDIIGDIPEEELAVMEKYYTTNISRKDDYRRRSLDTLLNNWVTELDRAANYRPKKNRGPNV